jgi:hypothetical protein
LVRLLGKERWQLAPEPFVVQPSQAAEFHREHFSDSNRIVDARVQMAAQQFEDMRRPVRGYVEAGG